MINLDTQISHSPPVRRPNQGSSLFKPRQIPIFRFVKTPLLLFLLIVAHAAAKAQNTDTSRINQSQSADRLLAPLKYLASDQLRGRHIGQPEIDTAAQYIADQFRQAGAKPVTGATGYFQLFSYQFDESDRYHLDRQVAADLPFSINIALKNVLALVRGTDPALRDQYIVLSSHYDHVGVGSPRMEDGKRDSIFNGARDNATGVAGVIAAARYFALHPARRSILFICYTAEEEGTIGSGYYASYPLIPIENTVFNLNIDNAGYNTTDAISLFGLGLMSSDTLIEKACHAYGLSTLPEPPGLDLFERSDNVSLAKRGVPAPTFSLGMTRWDAEVEQHYHRLSDEVSNLDLDYIVRFIRSYVLAASYIANDRDRPRWVHANPARGLTNAGNYSALTRIRGRRAVRATAEDTLLAPMKYLAADQFKGRRIGMPEVDTLARYIATEFSKAGAKPVAGNAGYLQTFHYTFGNENKAITDDPIVKTNLPWTKGKTYTLKNIIAVVGGTDPVLRDQYIVLSAHYDHLGVADTTAVEEEKKDSIFNGARDDAAGVAAVIGAARFFARKPPKRSVLFICYSGAEEGHLGSDYYAAHPLIPLRQTVYNLNIDNASYNTNEAVCLIGLGWTTADSAIIKASDELDLTVLDDPTNGLLYLNGDNASLAQKGIPATTFSMGMTDWSGSITDRFHRLSDEVGNMDLDYVAKFIKAYILAARNIANERVHPGWTPAGKNHLTRSSSP